MTTQFFKQCVASKQKQWQEVDLELRFPPRAASALSHPARPAAEIRINIFPDPAAAIGPV